MKREPISLTIDEAYEFSTGTSWREETFVEMDFEDYLKIAKGKDGFRWRKFLADWNFKRFYNAHNYYNYLNMAARYRTGNIVAHCVEARQMVRHCIAQAKFIRTIFKDRFRNLPR